MAKCSLINFKLFLFESFFKLFLFKSLFIQDFSLTFSPIVSDSLVSRILME